MSVVRRKRRLFSRRKRTLDPTTVIEYKNPETLKRFITDRGKIIPRRISGASALQQRQIRLAVKRARFLALIPYAVSHRTEHRFGIDPAIAYAATRPIYPRTSEPAQAAASSAEQPAEGEE